MLLLPSEFRVPFSERFLIGGTSPLTLPDNNNGELPFRHARLIATSLGGARTVSV